MPSFVLDASANCILLYHIIYYW